MQIPTPVKDPDAPRMDPDAPRMDADFFTEGWDNVTYHRAGSLKLRVFELLEELTLSSQLAEHLTTEVFWKSVPHSHRWSLQGEEAAKFVLDLTRATALDYLIKNATRVDGELTSNTSFSLWARLFTKADLSEVEKQVVLLNTGNFIQEGTTTRPLDAEEIIKEIEKALTEDQKALTEDQKALTEDQKALTEDQKALTEDQKALTEDQKALTEDQKALTEALTEDQKALTKAQKALTKDQKALTEAQKALTKDQKALTEALTEALTKDGVEKIIEQTSRKIRTAFSNLMINKEVNSDDKVGSD